MWLSKSLNEGGLGLDATKQYYVYDFWNDKFIGLINGKDKLEQHVRPGEARMMSVHAKEDHPQFISTNRHVMQGHLDMKAIKWTNNNKTLEAVSDVVEGDIYKVVIATNGYKVAGCTILNGRCSLKQMNEYFTELSIHVDKNATVAWEVKFK